MIYLASLYAGISVRQVEEVIRQRLIEQEAEPKARVDDVLPVVYQSITTALNSGVKIEDSEK